MCDSQSLTYIRRLILPLLLLCCFSACSDEQKIRQYRVAKEQANSIKRSVANQLSQNEQVWFFKLLTQKDQFEKFSNDFARMIIGADASGSEPEYNLPDGWSATPGPPPVYETIKVSEDDAEASLTVTALPAPQSAPLDYLKGNLNRWRRQLGLPPLTSQNWLTEAMESSEVVSIPKGNQFVTLVHYQGTTEKHGQTEMLVAILSKSSLTGTAAMASSSGEGSPPPRPVSNVVKYEKPEGWQESEGSSMRLVSLAAQSGKGTADVSVIRLPGGGEMLPNINRWRGQVKLDPLNADELEETLEAIKVADYSGKLSSIEGPEESIMIAIIDIDDVKWFFKMQGPTEAVKAESEHFREFLDSVELNLD